MEEHFHGLSILFTSLLDCNFLDLLLCVTKTVFRHLTFLKNVTLWVKMSTISRKIEPLQIDDSTHIILESTVINYFDWVFLEYIKYQYIDKPFSYFTCNLETL